VKLNIILDDASYGRLNKFLHPGHQKDKSRKGMPPK
jgi:hypothetical protein